MSLVNFLLSWEREGNFGGLFLFVFFLSSFFFRLWFFFFLVFGFFFPFDFLPYLILKKKKMNKTKEKNKKKKKRKEKKKKKERKRKRKRKKKKRKEKNNNNPNIVSRRGFLDLGGRLIKIIKKPKEKPPGNAHLCVKPIQILIVCAVVSN